jgi:hypothetical protein
MTFGLQHVGCSDHGCTGGERRKPLDSDLVDHDALPRVIKDINAPHWWFDQATPRQVSPRRKIYGRPLSTLIAYKPPDPLAAPKLHPFSSLFASFSIARDAFEIVPCSIWQSTASFAAATWSRSLCCRTGNPDPRDRRAAEDRSSSPVRNHKRRESQSSGWLERRRGGVEARLRTMPSRAGSITRTT